VTAVTLTEAVRSGGPVSPILVRPVREQFEHDRVIRVLQQRYRRKYEVAINPGSEQNTAVEVGDNPMYPDLVLFSPERGRRLQGTVEVETGESINTLEAMAEWGPFSRLRAPFFLYVPPNAVDTVRRLCTEHQVTVAEIWTYHTAVDQVRFTMVHRAPESAIPKPRPAPVKVEKPAARPPAAKPEKRPVAARAKAARPAPARKPAAAAKKAAKARPAKKATAKKAGKSAKRR
jgi:hypothetical protein